MNAVLTGNNRATRDAHVPAPALKDNGDTYTWRMFFDGGARIADADTLPELLDLLTPGYLESDEDERFDKRVELTKGIQGTLRASVLASVTPEQYAGLSDNEKALLEWEGFFDPEATWGEDGMGIWSSDVPLVLMDISYSPYLDNPPPMSSYGDHESVKNIIWLRPSAEEPFLRSLSRVGYITFGTPRAAPRPPLHTHE